MRVLKRTPISTQHTFSFLERRIIAKLLTNGKFYIGPKITDWLLPYFVFNRHDYGIFNIYPLITSIREMLYLVYAHTFTKKTIVVHHKKIQPDILTRLAYSFAGKWVGGFLTNFRRLMLRQILLDNYQNNSVESTQQIPTLSPTKIPYLPSLAISFNKPNHWFIVESIRLGIHCVHAIDYNLDPARYITNKLAINITTCPITTLCLLIRECISSARLDDTQFFKKRIESVLKTSRFKKKDN